MCDICGDNRFEVIDRAKEALIESTNIETSPKEMEVLNDFLFRCWQMGWLDKYEIVRCKDCKNWRESHSEDEESYCYIDGRTTDSTDYCSWAKMKGGAE